MVLFQYQFTDVTDDSYNVISDFSKYVCERVYETIDLNYVYDKIDIRLPYIKNDVTWIKWNSKLKDNITSNNIMEAIKESIIPVQYKNNIWKIEIKSKIKIPYSLTAIERFIRFLNYGDIKFDGTGIFSNLEHKFSHTELNNMWRYYSFKELGGTTQTKIVSN